MTCSYLSSLKFCPQSILPGHRVHVEEQLQGAGPLAPLPRDGGSRLLVPDLLRGEG